MLLGTALIEAGVITEAHLHKALQTQASNPYLSLGDIIIKLYGVPRHVIESHYVSRAIIPLIKEWLQRQINTKEISAGLSLASTLADIAVTVPFFSRYEGETISFELIEDGMYRENSSLTKIEKIMAIIEPLVVTTTRQQSIIFHNVHLVVSLVDKGVHPDNPGFLPELKLRLLKAFKEKE